LESEILNLQFDNRVGRLSTQSFPFVVEIVDHNVITHLVGGGVENASGIEPRQLIDETLPVKVRSQHKRIDLDPALRAALHFL
jgi:hypothetical protein